MKRFSNLLVALGVTIFMLTVGMKIEAEAQCPPGWTGAALTNIPVSLDNNNVCYLRVFYCHRDNGGVLEILITKIEFMDINCAQGGSLNTVAVWNQINIGLLNRIADPNVHGTQEFPPCNNPRRVTRIMKANCWKYSSLISPFEETVVAVPCITEDDFCIYNYRVCLDYNFNPPLVDIVFDGITEPVTINCDYHNVVVPIGVDFNTNPWDSPCTATCNE